VGGLGLGLFFVAGRDFWEIPSGLVAATVGADTIAGADPEEWLGDSCLTFDLRAIGLH
jgi:hypothetical protein